MRIRATSTCTRRWVEKRISPESWERIRIYRIRVSGSIRAASSCRSFKSSSDTSTASPGSREVFTSRRFLRYQVKSDTKRLSSRPSRISFSRTFTAPDASPERILRSRTLNTSVSAAPRTFKTLS